MNVNKYFRKNHCALAGLVNQPKLLAAGAMEILTL
jgi:hypothetical protein